MSERETEREREIEGGRERAGESREEKRREGEEERRIDYALDIINIYATIYNYFILIYFL